MHDWILDLPIQKKLLLAIFVASGAALLLVSIGISAYEMSTFRPQALNVLKAQATILASTLAASLIFDDTLTAASTLQVLSATPSIQVSSVFTVEGDQFAHYTREGSTLLTSTAPAMQLESGHRFKDNALHLTQVISYEGEVLGHLYIGQHLAPLIERLPKYSILVVAVIVAVLAVGIMLSWFVERTIGDRLRALANIARQVTQHRNYSTQADMVGRDEAGTLALALNEMFSTIESEVDAHAQAAAALKESESKLTQYLNSLPIGVWVTDREGIPLFLNQYALRMLSRFAPEEVVDIECIQAKPKRKLIELYPIFLRGSDSAYPVEKMPITRALAGEPSMEDDLEIRQNGRSVFLEVSASPIFDDKGAIRYAIATFADISDRLLAQEKVTFLANHDPLTRCANRRGFHERLELTLAHAKRYQSQVALLFMDLDHFKDINDTYGHHVADQLLVQMGQRLQNAVRQDDTVARLGGDEFAIVLANLASYGSVTSIAEGS